MDDFELPYTVAFDEGSKTLAATHAVGEENGSENSLKEIHGGGILVKERHREIATLSHNSESVGEQVLEIKTDEEATREPDDVEDGAKKGVGERGVRLMSYTISTLYTNVLKISEPNTDGLMGRLGVLRCGGETSTSFF